MNPVAPASVPVAPPARPRRRWWPIVMLIVVLLVAGPLLLHGYLTYSLSSAWEEAEAEADRLDPRWRLLEIEADRRPVADAHNSALHAIIVWRQGKGVSIAAVPNYNAIFHQLPANAQLNHQQEQLLRGELAKIVQPLEAARRLKEMPYGHFPLRYNDDYISTLLPDHQNARQLADWLMNDAWLLAQEGRHDPAIESCQALLNTARTMGDEPILISQLMQLAMQTEALHTLQRVLAQGEASDAKLQAMQDLIALQIRETHWLHSMRGIRGSFHFLFDNIRRGKVSDTTLLRAMSTGKAAGSMREWIHDKYPSTVLKYYPEHLRHMNRGVEIARLPIHERWPKFQAWDTESNQSKNPLIHSLLSHLQKAHQAECRGQCLLRVSQVALACERYRLRHERWPAHPDALVKDRLLASLPTDPMDDQPLRYRPLADGVIVYSIGMDLQDDQGHLDRAHPDGPGVDIGFRLWDVRQRRRQPLPPVALPEVK